jgi:hypothetical protein
MKQHVALTILTIGLTIGFGVQLRAMSGDVKVENKTNTKIEFIYTSFCSTNYFTGWWHEILPNSAYNANHPFCSYGPVVIKRSDNGNIIFAKGIVSGPHFRCVITQEPNGQLAVNVY